MQTQGVMTARGQLEAQVFHAYRRADWRWRVRNAIRPVYWRGWLGHSIAPAFSKAFGVLTITPKLEVRVRRLSDEQRAYYESLRDSGQREAALAYARSVGVWQDYGTVAYRVITEAGVAFVVDDWDNDAKDITNLHFHGCGTGVAAEAATDTALGTESTTALNPDNTRATGTESQPAANQLRTVGTLTFDATAAVTEHGIFDQAATGGGSLWDRSVFSAINVVSGDSIQFTYTASLTSGG